MQKISLSVEAVLLTVALLAALARADVARADVAHADLVPGNQVSNLTLRDTNNRPALLPDLGQKVLTLFYVDPDVKGQTKTFSELLKKAKLDKSKHRVLGVVNMKDTWKPDFIIRKMIRGNSKAFGSLVLMDPDHRLKKAWRLKKTNGTIVVIVIGRDKKVKLISRGTMTSAQRASTLSLIKAQLNR